MEIQNEHAKAVPSETYQPKYFIPLQINQSQRDLELLRCGRCVMDTTAPGIEFGEQGECSFCRLHDRLEAEFSPNSKNREKFQRILKGVKKRGQKNQFDCIIGFSGGRDSTYLLYLSKHVWGLRPLAVHFNDGFDNPVAGENIKNAVRKLDIPLRTITSDWRESKDLRRAFLRASVPNLEVGTDLGIFSALYGVAIREQVKYIFTGHSFRTEGISPLSWNYVEGKYLKSVVEQYGSLRFRKWQPDDPGYNLSLYHLFYYLMVRGIRTLTPMFYVDYHRKDADDVLSRELGWTNTGAHYFDDLYQSLLFYVYRTKFNIDKRKFNYSALIRSGQLTREAALERLKQPYCIEDPKVIDLCIKRLGLTREEFEDIMRLSPKTFQDYKTYYGTIRRLRLPIKIACKLHLIPMATYDKFFNCV